MEEHTHIKIDMVRPNLGYICGKSIRRYFHSIIDYAGEHPCPMQYLKSDPLSFSCEIGELMAGGAIHLCIDDANVAELRGVWEELCFVIKKDPTQASLD